MMMTTMTMELTEEMGNILMMANKNSLRALKGQLQASQCKQSCGQSRKSTFDAGS